MAKKGLNTRRGGEGYVEHGGNGGCGKHRPNQVVPARDEVPLVPSDTGQFDQHTGVAPSDGGSGGSSRKPIIPGGGY